MKPNDFPSALIDQLRRARSIAVLTGAGISAESGVPTFRDALTGMWAKFDPEELATPEAFRRNSKLVWEWYAWRRQLVANAKPNPGHSALVRLEQRVPEFTLITQNVDGLHARAGSRHIIELHGNVTRTKCFEEDAMVENWPETGDVPPRCPRCGGRLRPDVVWFGEMLPMGAWESALAAAQRCEIFFSIGTSTVVHPAASLPYEAQEAGAVTIEINLDITPFTPRSTHAFHGPAGVVLPALLQAVWHDLRGSVLI